MVRSRNLILAIACLGTLAPAFAQPPDAVNDANEQALRAAAANVAPSVVQIETSGGTDAAVIGSGARTQMRKGVGPTTGLVVGADGTIISSAFNFTNKPAAVFVAVPGRRERLVAKVVATDQTRMITLLKVDATGLPVPATAPKAELRIGQWAVALGRTLDPVPDHPPSMSVGIVSALGRVWGKAVQTDAKVSPANYGGPLVDLQGRVIGVLVPASPNGDGDTAGVEWYDSGIGFAIPLEDVLAVLPKLREGKDLRRGLLGVAPKVEPGVPPDMYGAPPVVGTVSPESAAAKAGIISGDLLVSIDGHPVVNQAQIRHALGTKYEGDVVSVKVKRDGKEIEFKDVALRGQETSVLSAFLGIVPLRDDPELGVAVRYVFPKSPADLAGVKAGDRIVKVGAASGGPLRPFSGRDELATMLEGLSAGSEIKVEVEHKESKKTEAVTVKLAALPDAPVPDALPEPSSAGKALAPRKHVAAPQPPPKKEEPKKDEPAKGEEKKDDQKPEEKKAETGLLERASQARDREYWVYVPENYDPNVSHALVIWLHAAAQFGGKDAHDMADIWQAACEDQHVILVGPKSRHETGWLPSESEAIQEDVKEVLGQYTIDRRRVVAHGMGVGGQMAIYLGFNARDLVRGVAATGAVLGTQPKDNLAGQPLSFFVVAGGKDPLAKEIAESAKQLTEKKFPVVHREVAEMGKEYLDAKTFAELVRWIDSLDRL
jgi:S1-C subfamily serine protease/predicted esterase